MATAKRSPKRPDARRLDARERRALAYLDGIDPRDIQPGLERVREVLRRLGNPEDRLRIVRVGGTNGKGSVSVQVASALSRAGLRAGLYTSPHLIDVRERIRVDGACIRPSALARAIERIRRAQQRRPAVRLTYFEILTAAALLEFVRRRVEVAVLEVGLGGRWDATNVGAARIAVLTNVELDHTEFLGSTRASIAREKVAIARPGGVLVTGVTGGAARRVVEEHAARVGFRVEVPAGFPPGLGRGGVFRYAGKRFSIDAVKLALGGDHQARNAALAVRTLEELVADGLEIPVAAVRDTLGETRWPGRLDAVPGRPSWLFDGAHNPHGAAALARALPSALRAVRGARVLVVGALRTKHPDQIVAALARVRFERVICTRPPRDDAMEPRVLARVARAAGARAVAVEDWREAVDRARTLARPDGVVVVAGSLYLVGAVMARAGVSTALCRSAALARA
ncbi:MAG: bifunctional folylpolyglutamate synthase/dihydrofolate synthase [Deltaproteobacteria bacterium]|nr:bifunctional folylpolyglutamate synthase/dihydrofolate synthase [Deltaproteobacteria bacterium]